MDWEGKESIAISFHDITHLKAIDEYKNKLLASVSHNLRTPLHSVIANLEIALKNIISKSEKKLIKIAKYSAFILLNSVNDLLDYAQFNSNALKISKK